MDKTPFSKKCEILAEALLDWKENETFGDFFEGYDLGGYYASGVYYGHITVNEKGQEFIEQTWQEFCELLVVDHHGYYTSFEDLLGMADYE
jgi:hypothetical protein